jgi:hypothetical protein
MIKIICGMVAGFLLSCSLFYVAKAVLPASADSSDNSTGGLAGLLPDFEEIYNQALTMPFKKAESKIYDPEIAEYYHELIQSTGLGGTEADK